MDILNTIIDRRRADIEAGKAQTDIGTLQARIESRGISAHRPFEQALKRADGHLAVIAEVKKASPSKGVIREDFHPTAIAGDYLQAGADALSILTEPHFFQGADAYLTAIRKESPLPILRKDFTFDLWQVYHSRDLGADAILLIAAVLSTRQMQEFQAAADSVGLSCLVEVHDEEDLEKALAAGAKIVGINNRNLRTFEVSLKTTERLIRQIPQDKIIVSESGIATHDDMQAIQAMGAHAVLVGETLMRARHIGEAFRTLTGR